MKSVELINFPAREQKIKHFVSSQNQLIVITETNIVYRYRLDNEQAQELGFQPYYLPKLKGDGGFFKGVGSIVGGKSNKSDSIERAFLDQKGYHAILCSDHGENYYLNLKDEKIKHLNAIRGKTIKVLAFESTTTEDNTKDFIFGTDEGEIYSWSINSKNLESGLLEKQLEISDRNSTQNSISHMHILELQQDQGGRTLLVIISTNQNICCLHGSSELRFLFKKYNDPEKLKQSMVLMPKMHPSVMDICYNQSTRPTSMIWTNGMVIQCYQIPGRKEQITQNIIKNYQAYKYAKRLDPPDNNPYLVQEIPIGIGISEYHYYLLHSDGLTIISRITESVVQHYDLRSMGYVLGMSYDKDQKTYWIYSTNQVQKLDIENENKDAWKLYVEKQDYEQAYNICKEYDNPYKNYIGSLYGDQLFVGKQYVQAAIQYFEVNKSFEEIFFEVYNWNKVNTILLFIN